MKSFRDLSISRKLILLAVATSLLALLGTVIALTVNDHRTSKAGMVENYSTTADVFGQNCLASLEFSDAEDAQSVLSSLQFDTQVSLACLYDGKRNVFASFLRETEEAPTFEQVQHLSGKFTSDGYLHLVRPIRRGNKLTGSLYLRVSLQKVWVRLYDQLYVAGLVLLGSVLLSVGLAAWLQRAISQPILQLVETAHRVVQSGDYSLRAKKVSNDELGELVSEFNTMLTAIEGRDSELTQHRENLTELVRERTAELERKTKEALAASVAKSDFLANMSHEIRTPLNAIMGYADLLRRGWSDSEEERDEMLGTVVSSGRHLMTVINDILDLSKIEAGHIELELQSDSPHRVLSEVVSLMRVPFREKNLSLDYNWEGQVPEMIETDGARLRQILINLLGNAKKFTLAGGVRMIARVERKSLPAQLVIDVIDTGVGIPSDKQNQIFEPFMQADTSVTRKFGGTGLGLSISRRLARLMGGDLTVESSPGAGSDFRLSVATGDIANTRFVSLNAVGDVIPTRKQRGRPSADVPLLTGLRVLLVDDGDSNRKLISLILKRAGAKLVEACDGQQACDAALGSETFDVILLDMQMPIMDGYTAAGKMREAGLTTPIIALTAHAMKGDREQCLEAGCSDYLTKPVSAEELLARMEQVHALSPHSVAIAEATITQLEAEPIQSNLPVEDPEFAEIVIDFIPVLQREVARLATAVEERNPVDSLASAHWIKGAAGTAGFACFTNPAAQICLAIRSSTWTDIDRLMLTIQNYAERVEAPPLVAALID